MKLHCEISFGSMNKAGEELCGDRVEVVRRKNDTIIVLSDGLGSGVKANILSTLTAKIISTMVSAGAEMDEVIETIVSTLPVCNERKVAYSTFTVLQVDHFGNAFIVEYDNPRLVIMRDGSILPSERTTRSYGDKTLTEWRLKLCAEDMLVFFSDGVIHAGVGTRLKLGWGQENVEQFLEKNYVEGQPAYAVQNSVLDHCRELYMSRPGDDTTVAVCHMRAEKMAFVMIGPPVERKDDISIVNRLMTFDGYKIVCGGTTSQIVSRVTGKELTADISYITPSVPPVGRIEGIDLVTEGVVTLGRTLELLKRYASNGAGREGILLYNKDAAHLLAQMLVFKCTGIKFAVGRALNPAHQNPNMSIDLSIKLRLVEEISICLRRLDKKVEVLYY